MKDAAHLYITDFGVVSLSAKTVEYLDSITPEWRLMVDKPAKTRRDRAKFRLRQRALVNELFAALRTCKRRAFVLDEDLRVF